MVNTYQKQDEIKFSKDILNRMEGKCNSYPIPGWMEIIENLNTKLSGLHPNYKIIQIKEKLGGLRFYASGVPSTTGQALIAEAERQSFHTCDECGKEGKIRNIKLDKYCTLYTTKCGVHYELASKK